ncbi:MAG: hypothetical protein QXU02_04430 [Candidatus Bathyarchaeia archaeon]
MKGPLPQYKSSMWIDPSGKPVSCCLVYDKVFVETIVENPLRMQSAIGLVKVAIFKSNKLLPDTLIKHSKHIVTLPPLSSEKIVVSFKPPFEAEYYYKVFIEDEEVYMQPKGSPPRLRASKRESRIFIEKISEFSRNPGFTVVGKLVDAITGEGIERARVEIYDSRIFRNDKMLAHGTTDKSGSFIVEGLKTLKIGDQIKVYVKFKGDDIYKPAVSGYFAVKRA